MKVLVTGGAGFIGSCFIREVIKRRSSYEVVNVDKLTYAGNLDNLREVETSSRYRFVQADIVDEKMLRSIVEQYKIEAIVNFAAESHVDRSIHDSVSFIHSNIVGTHRLLELVRHMKIKRFVQVSTDEVYGALGGSGSFTEESPLAPNSPYAASKASADLWVRSYFKTYGLPVMITRSSNNYGPYQYPEKLIPLFIVHALENETLPLYGDGLYIRDWVHIEDHSLGILSVLENGKEGEIYNIGSRCEKKNIDIAHQILKLLGKSPSLLRHVEDRLGHDRRYAIDPSKIENELHWRPKYHLDDELPSLIQWYRDNKKWWKKINASKS